MVNSNIELSILNEIDVWQELPDFTRSQKRYGDAEKENKWLIVNNTQNAMMQTIQCKLFSYNINNYNGTYFLMRQKNTKV